jgi:hypothetical protein
VAEYYEQVPFTPYTGNPDKDYLLQQFFKKLSNTGRKHMASQAVAAAGLQTNLTFRCNVKAAVSSIGVVLGSVSSATLILTALFNGSVMAILTLSNSANEAYRTFTLAAARTVDTMLDRIEIHAAKDKGDISIIYDYRIL